MKWTYFSKILIMGSCFSKGDKARVEHFRYCPLWSHWRFHWILKIICVNNKVFGSYNLTLNVDWLLCLCQVLWGRRGSVVPVIWVTSVSLFATRTMIEYTGLVSTRALMISVMIPDVLTSASLCYLVLLSWCFLDIIYHRPVYV
jgi:hypothetical protein